MNKRLKEPSTYAGLGVLLLGLTRIFAPQYSAIADVVISTVCTVAGGAAVVLPEKGSFGGDRD